MSFQALPTEIKSYIADMYFNAHFPSKLYRGKVRHCGRAIKQLLLVNSELFKIFNEKMSTLKRIHELLNKYKHYQENYENPAKDLNNREFDFKGNPQLYDALQTGSKIYSSASTFKIYNQDIENDIKEIVKLMPQSVHCIISQLVWYREELTPLYAACFNSNIPISIIEFLLKNKANPNNYITLSLRPFTILQDLRMNKEAFPVDRILKIEELFRKYGAKT